MRKKASDVGSISIMKNYEESWHRQWRDVQSDFIFQGEIMECLLSFSFRSLTEVSRPLGFASPVMFAV